MIRRRFSIDIYVMYVYDPDKDGEMFNVYVTSFSEH